MNFTYILRCGDGTLYTGWTNDLEKRLAAHNAGKGGKYTRSRLPVELVYYEEHETREAAMSREWQIKQLPRVEKLALITKRNTACASAQAAEDLVGDSVRERAEPPA